ncbi:hypothetical protein DFS34DRAFT_618975, partial [Phlyctochytrium arcticum]
MSFTRLRHCLSSPGSLACVVLIHASRMCEEVRDILIQTWFGLLKMSEAYSWRSNVSLAHVLSAHAPISESGDVSGTLPKVESVERGVGVQTGNKIYATSTSTGGDRTFPSRLHPSTTHSTLVHPPTTPATSAKSTSPSEFKSRACRIRPCIDRGIRLFV